ncbi:LysE family translocator [Amycolatopsis taiwanensis]|uniref:Threonine transporter RhtB n=1 Tax=Amycolatopsis taiwanensis TaxID=342230 RepID=A0A9W6VHN5_9PSEU|nr:LysE family translocator [Amycolatopsis taiwanensis]GLY68885.1 threonine transporter RhtB [Amycolatopsis taiwanensis]
MIGAVLAFAGVAALINITPGLDTLLVVRASAAQGRSFGLAAASGVLVGCLAWGAATAVGLTALLTASHLAYDVLRFAGAAYLAWLGVLALVRSRHRTSTEGSSVTQEDTARSRLAAFRSGVGTNLLNPKAGVFYMSLIPQFIPQGAPAFGTTLLFTAVDLVELAIWFWLVSGAAHALSERIRRPSFRRRMEQISGVAFLGFSVNVLAEHRG